MTLELRQICLRYAKKTVLDNLCLTLKGSAIHALLGENGAGKSTTANIICGELAPDSGTILLDGKPHNFDSPKDAIDCGICYVHQTPMLADSISIKENLLFGIKKEYRQNIEKVASIWLPGIPLQSPAKNLAGGMRFFLALCSALIKCPGLLILDEPTALLDQEQKDFLFKNLRELAGGGMNILIITHNYKEAVDCCDTVDFLEDGHLVPKKELPLLVEKKYLAEQKAGLPQDNLLDFRLENGKITLIQGLAEDGLTALEKIVTGMEKNQQAWWKRFGRRSQVAIIPTDKKYTGSNPNLTIMQMLTAALEMPEKEKAAAALKMIKASGVNITPYEKCKNLSGGMLQKLLFERELFNDPELLILCNPLQGLDYNTSQKTYRRIKEAALKGSRILVLSYGAFPPQFCDYYYRLNKGQLEAV